MHEAVAAAHEEVGEFHSQTGIYNNKMGMWIFLCSEVMFFTGLIGSYVVLRFASKSWPNPQETLNIPLTAFNTFLLICSSVAMVKAFASAEMGLLPKVRFWLIATFLMGASFLLVQVVEYRKLLHEGFTPSKSLFGSVFYVCTGFHGFHVFCGVVCMAFVTIKAFRGKYSQADHRGIETVGLYWHFVDLVWILLFTVIYLI